jgi:UDP-N-acetylglucosamine:LPS N-acetylglucosamine transferase
MKILEINKYYFVKGGAEKHFFDVIDLLKSAGNEVAVFSMAHNKNRQSEWNKYFVSEVGYTSEYSFGKKLKGIFRMFYSWEARKKINKVLDEFKPEIVHIHNIYHQLSPAILFEIKKRNIPITLIRVIGIEY